MQGTTIISLVLPLLTESSGLPNSPFHQVGFTSFHMSPCERVVSYTTFFTYCLFRLIGGHRLYTLCCTCPSFTDL